MVDFRHARVVDHSGLEAIDGLAERYRVLGKRLHLRHLSPDCLNLLDKARDMVEVNLMEAPLPPRRRSAGLSGAGCQPG